MRDAARALPSAAAGRAGRRRDGTVRLRACGLGPGCRAAELSGWRREVVPKGGEAALGTRIKALGCLLVLRRSWGWVATEKEQV